MLPTSKPGASPAAPERASLPFINWRSTPKPGGKPDKVPWCTVLARRTDHLDPANWLDAATAMARAGGDIHRGQVLPVEPSGYFLIDLDKCRDPATGVVQPWAACILESFPGAFVEVSHSGTGLHVIARCDPTRMADRRHKWTPEGAPHHAAEFYHAGRFIALGVPEAWRGAWGSAELDCTDALLRIVPAGEADSAAVAPDDPPPADYNGPTDDDALLDLMRMERLRKGGDLAPGLYAIDFFTSIDRLRALIQAQPMPGGWHDPTKPAPWDFDGSSADMSLMNHLAYYTGCDVPRMVRLHARSVIGPRPKALDRPRYVIDTAVKAASKARADGRYLKSRVAEADEILALIQENPHTAAHRLAARVAGLPPEERARVLAECAEYRIKTEMERAVKQAAADQRRAATEQAGLIAGGNGEPLANAENVRRFLTTSPQWVGMFVLNDHDKAVWTTRPEARRMDDADIFPVLTALQSGPTPNVQKHIAWDGVEAAAIGARIHPVRQYLDGLAWDGRSRLAHLFTDLFPGEAPSPEAREYLVLAGRRFCIGAVARVMQPGCKVDTMPVLIGPQGARKSSGLKALVGAQWFGDDLPDVTTKDAKDWLRGIWIGEIGELSAMRGKDAEHVKAFLSTAADKFRKAYGRLDGTFPRQTVFVGTTNDPAFLIDATGGRRFWPVRLRPDTRVDVDGITAARGQIWAEAVAAYRAGERWWFDEGENQHLLHQQEAARVRDIDEENLRAWLRMQPDRVTASEAARAVWGGTASGDASASRRMARYLTAAGWEWVGKVQGTRQWARTRRAEPHEAGGMAAMHPQGGGSAASPSLKSGWLKPP